MRNTSNFSSNLKEARLKKGLSQNAVAEKLNISRQAISRWETGKGMPDINTLPMLSELYDISIDELLGHESSVSENKPQNNTADTTQSEETVSDKNITKKEIDTHSISSRFSNTFNFEYAILMLLLITSSFITFAGLIVSTYILVWTWRNRRHYKLILILSVICLLIGLNHLIVFVISFFPIPIFDTYTIEKVS